MDKYYAEIVANDGQVIKRLGPFTEIKAKKIASGAGRNLDWARFYTQVTKEKEVAHG